MRINHNIAAMLSQNSLAIHSKALNKSLERLSTGLRINRASDDAAGLSVAEQLQTQVRGLAQAQRNGNEAVALLQIAEGGASEISSLLQRMRELAVQSANDTLTTNERTYTDTEFQSLMTEVNRISHATQYNGMTLLDGGSGSFGTIGGASIIHVGPNSTSNDTISIALDAISLNNLGLALGTTNISTSGASGASTAITSIDTAIESVNNMRSDLGAYINRMEYAMNNIANQELNMQNAEAQIRDVDMAQEATLFTKAQILTQIGANMLAQANAIPASIVPLFME